MAALRKLEGAFTSGRLRKVSTREEIKINSKPNVEEDPTAELFNMISDAEGTWGNYNAFYGNSHNKEVQFTKMTVDEVLGWQSRFVSNGSDSSAVGKYQVIQGTLIDVKSKLGLSGSELYDEQLQEKIGRHLLDKKRGYSKWLAGELTDEKFANNLAKEWASFPVIGGANHGRSYYAGDKLNKAHKKPEEILGVLKNVRGRLSKSGRTA